MRLLITLLLAAASSAALARDDASNAGSPAADSTATTAPTPIALKGEDLRAFVAVFRAIKDGYVDEVDDRTLMRGAIQGLVSELDPHSFYLDAEQLKQWDEDSQGLYGGIGIEVIGMEGALRVIAPIDDTPAARAGIRGGDSIVILNGQAVEGREYEAIDELRGAPGTTISLGIEREGSSEIIELTLVREVVLAQSVRARWLESGIAYARISQFQENSGQELRDRLRKLHADEGQAQGLVLDLRSNPGGVLDAAVDVADTFLQTGLIVSTDGRHADTDARYEAQEGDLLDGAPLVVLIDSGSASASEIVAGALQDHQRALIVGQRSFGKGSVQNILPLDGGGAIKLTTARYFTPSGHSIQAAGIKPDIVLPLLKLVPEDSGPQLLSSEASLPGHLEAETNAGEETEAHDAEVDSDYVLHAGVNALKTLIAAERLRPRQG